MSIESEKYVVLDVETNGLNYRRDDLLSLSIYQPDTGKIYNKYLPLELNDDVYTTIYNGIKNEDLVDAKALTQAEVDKIISDFDLENRIVLTYGRIDKGFMSEYFKRKKLWGIQYFIFYNFKEDIISSRFSEGNVTKDNLCRLYGVENVKEVHSGANDCVLEWKLFEHMNGHKLLITDNKVYELNENYVVPASFLDTHNNFKRHMILPHIGCNGEEVKKFEIYLENATKFPTNFNGIAIEHLINTMLNVQNKSSELYLLKNKSQLKYIGTLPTHIYEIPVFKNADGTLISQNEHDKAYIQSLNDFIVALGKKISPLIDYIKNDIFNNQEISSQELVINSKDNVLAVCDLSTIDTVMEIKTSYHKELDFHKYQLYYQANGRDIYILQMKWGTPLTFVISKVDFIPKRSKNMLGSISLGADISIENKEFFPIVTLKCNKCKSTWEFSLKNYRNEAINCPICNKRDDSKLQILQKRLNSEKAIVKAFDEKTMLITVQCQNCQYEWKTSCRTSSKKICCPHCSCEELKENSEARSREFSEKIQQMSNGKISVKNYLNSRTPVLAECMKCGYQWKIRSDHLLEKLFCPICGK